MAISPTELNGGFVDFVKNHFLGSFLQLNEQTNLFGSKNGSSKVFQFVNSLPFQNIVHVNFVLLSIGLFQYLPLLQLNTFHNAVLSSMEPFSIAVLLSLPLWMLKHTLLFTDNLILQNHLPKISTLSFFPSNNKVSILAPSLLMGISTLFVSSNPSGPMSLFNDASFISNDRDLCGVE